MKTVHSDPTIEQCWSFFRIRSENTGTLIIKVKHLYKTKVKLQFIEKVTSFVC